MNVHLTRRAVQDLGAAPLAVQKAFIKQINYLIRDLNHPSLHAKKFDAAMSLWQARVNDDWRFYFVIKGDVYSITGIVPHPK